MVDRPCLWIEEGILKLLDQRQLPGRTTIIEPSTISEQVEAIRALAVRGAPAIGVFGGFSLAFALERGEDLDSSYRSLLDSRPTAVDLRNCLDMVAEAHRLGGPEKAMVMAEKLMRDTIDSCMRIGQSGKDLIPQEGRVMTHCNAGALATLDWGTALAPIRLKAREGGKPFVWVSETRPLLQGSRLTAWELLNEGIDHRIIVDSASGHMMSKEEVDLVIVGTDRVAANGDIANKIGTLEKAIIAREFDIPFYVAFPETTFDPQCGDGSSIPIEIRSSDEIVDYSGIRTGPLECEGLNPAFDVTPARFITGYITEEGVLSLEELKRKRKTRP